MQIHVYIGYENSYLGIVSGTQTLMSQWSTHAVLPNIGE